MASIKRKVIMQFVFSVLASVLGSIIVIHISSFLTIPPSWIQSAIIFILVFIIIFLTIWTINTYNYINRILTYIHDTAFIYLKQIPSGLAGRDNEEQFQAECMKMVEVLLQRCAGIANGKVQPIKKKVKILVLVLFPEGERLVVRNISDSNNKFGISPGDKFNKDKYFASWVFNEEETKSRNAKKKGRTENCLAVISSSLPVKERKKDNLPFRSAIGIPLKLYEETIAELIIGSNKENFMVEEDLFPAAIIGQYIISAHVHLNDYCPWHRKGWRDEKLKNDVLEQKFSFSCKDYRWDSELEGKVLQSQSARRLENSEKLNTLNSFKKNCEDIENLCTAKSPFRVFLCGTFNGWNETITPMKADPSGDVWRCILNLPKGRYRYQFRIPIADGDDIWICDPKLSFWIDGWDRMQSVFKIV